MHTPRTKALPFNPFERSCDLETAILSGRFCLGGVVDAILFRFLYQIPETIGTNLGRAGSPLLAARPHNDCGAHGVTRPTHVPIPTGIGIIHSTARFAFSKNCATLSQDGI